MSANPMAAQQRAQAAPPPQMAQAPSEDARMGGIAAAGGDMFNTMGYAGGGIIAFENGGDVPFATLDENGNVMPLTTAQKKEREAEKKAAVKTAAKDTNAAPKEAPMSEKEAYITENQKLKEKFGIKSGASEEDKAYADILSKQQAGLGEATSAKERANLAKAFLKMGANPRGFLPGAIEGAESYLTGAGEIAASKQAQELTLSKANAERAAGIRARDAGDFEAANKHFDNEATLKNQLKIAQGNNATTLAAAATSAAASKLPYQMQKEEKEAVRAELRTKLGREPTMTEVIAAYSTASNKTADTTVQGQIEKAFAAETELINLKLQNTELDPATRKKLEEQKVQIYQNIVKRITSGQPTAAASAPNTTPKDIQDILNKYPKG
jgi:hypothetical protein